MHFLKIVLAHEQLNILAQQLEYRKVYLMLMLKILEKALKVHNG